jgi:2-keto-4-pentenoate hydratase/2-oxohepta-3-ene-1,7-dioic acid hydratase in catechol pathway
MKLTTIELRGGVGRVAAIQDDGSAVDLAALSEGLAIGPGGFPRDMLDLVTAGQTMSFFLERCETAIEKGDAAEYTLAAGTFRYLAPIPRPKKIVCINANRPNSSTDLLEPKWGGDWPRPQFFLKAPTGVIGHNEHLFVEPQMSTIQPEGELAVVIGRTARRVTEENALDFVAGITLLGDYSASLFGLQDGVVLHIKSKDGVEDFINRPMARAKGIDTFSPTGPWIIPMAQAPELSTIRVWVDMVNADGSRLRIQDGVIGDQVFTPQKCIATVTKWMTLDPGDIVSLGAVANVPGRHLRDNDLGTLHGGSVQVHGEGIGTLINPVTVFADGESTSIPAPSMQRKVAGA